MSNPDVAPAALLAVYCLAAFLGAVGGGFLPSAVRLTHVRMQVTISFVAGLMLGLALLGLAPHAMDHPGSTHLGAAWLLARDLMAGQIGDVLVESDRNGSLPTTHAGGRRWRVGQALTSFGSLSQTQQTSVV